MGQLPLFDEAAAALYAEHDGEIGRLGSLHEVLAEPSLEPIAVLAPLSSAADVDLLPALVARKILVLLVADVVNHDLRERALEQGVIDVLFPPVSAAQISAAFGALRGEAPPRIARHRAGFPATLQREGESIDVTVVNISSAGLEAEIPWSGPEAGAVLRAELTPPAPHGSIHLYCRVLTTAGLHTGGVRIQARFIGLTAEESSSLVDLVDTLPAWPEELASILETVDMLDVAALRKVAVGQSMAVRLPAFTALEEEALSAGWGTDTTEDGGVGDAAVARVSAALLADVLEVDAQMPGSARIAHALQALQKSSDAMRAMAKAIPDADGERLQMVRDLQKRLASAADRIQRLTGLTKAPAKVQMKGVASTPMEKALGRLPEGPMRWGILAGIPSLALIVFAVVGKLVFFPGDVARSTVAAKPQMTVMGIRVVEVDDMRGKHVAVVDGSWFTASEDERQRMARIVRQSLNLEAMDVQDVRGRPLAHVEGMDVTLFPLPQPRDTPPSS